MVLDPNAGTDWMQKESRVAEGEMVRWHQWLNGHESEQTLRDSEGQGSLVCCTQATGLPTDTTEWLNSNRYSLNSSEGKRKQPSLERNRSNFAVVQDLQKVAQLQGGLFSFQDVGWEIFSAWCRHLSLLMESVLG